MRFRRLTQWLPIALIGCAPEPESSAESQVVFVADVESREVRRFDARTGEDLGTVVVDGELPEAAGPDGFAPAGLSWWDGALVVTNFVSGEVVALEPSDGSLLDVLFTPRQDLPPLEEPCAIAWVGPELAVLGNDTRNVVLMQPEDTRTAWSLADIPIRYGHGLVVLGDTLVVATSPSQRDLGLLQRFDLTTGERLDHFAPWGQLQDATGVTVGPDGLLYVTDWFGEQVLRYHPDTGAFVDTFAAELDQPVSAAFTDDGDLLVLQRHSLLSIAASGQRTVLADDLVFGRGLVLD